MSLRTLSKNKTLKNNKMMKDKIWEIFHAPGAGLTTSQTIALGKLLADNPLFNLPVLGEKGEAITYAVMIQAIDHALVQVNGMDIPTTARNIRQGYPENWTRVISEKLAEKIDVPFLSEAKEVQAIEKILEAVFCLGSTN
jgi:hypothetical protein